MKKYQFNPNTDERCLLETLIDRVFKHNIESDTFEGNIIMFPAGVRLEVHGVIIGHQTWRNYTTANEKEHLEDMLKWLDEQYAIEHRDEEDPKIEAQRELDKEQI